ncbi:hypothetical protein M0R36_11360 [bacterium]|jgi:hypothetical protein|nr:hypothetical protein [bacterium]
MILTNDEKKTVIALLQLHILENAELIAFLGDKKIEKVLRADIEKYQEILLKLEGKENNEEV